MSRNMFFSLEFTMTTKILFNNEFFAISILFWNSPLFSSSFLISKFYKEDKITIFHNFC